MLPIQKRLTPYNYTAMSGKKNEFIVVHYVGAVSTAENNVDYYANNRLQASANYFVDETSIWQSVDDQNKAWHCGGGLQGAGGHEFYGVCANSNSIGIEMCCKKDVCGNWYFAPATVDNTADLVKHLMQKYNIPIDRVIRHYDVTGKICPAPYIDGAIWAAFQNKLTDEGDEPMTNEERAEFTGLINAVEGLTAKVDKLSNPMIYAWIDDNMPEWAKPTIAKLCEKGYLKGDSEGKLNLTDEMLRILVINDRSGIYDKE